MTDQKVNASSQEHTSRRQLGQQIRKLREAAGLRQEDLAKSIKRSESTVSKIEAGLHPLDYDLLLSIASALHISPMRLFWQAQRISMVANQAQAQMVPVFDALLDSLERADKT